MKTLGFVVDGKAEYASLKSLLDTLELPQVQIKKVLLADMQPHAPAKQVASAAKNALKVLKIKGVSHVVVCIDHEDRQDCIPKRRAELETCLRAEAQKAGIENLDVVIKNPMFENWLVADPDGLGSLGRFSISVADRRKVVPNKADHVDALNILKKSCRDDYAKVNDAKYICANIDPATVASNSRSFRRLLRVVGCPNYQNQSKRP